MIYQITNPQGIDFYIQRLQSALYTFLKTEWSLTDSTAGTVLDSYGRVYGLWTKDSGIIPHVFTGKAEYKEVLFDDTRACVMFFDMGNTFQTTPGYASANVSLYVHLNLGVIFPTTVYRLDENVRLAVKNYLDADGKGFIVNAVQTGERKVFENYSGYRKRVGLKYTDMHPFHCFRVDMTIPNYSTQEPFCNTTIN